MRISAHSAVNPATRKSLREHRASVTLIRARRSIPALSSFHCDPPVCALRARQQERGRLRPQQIATAAMRKFVHLRFGVLKTRKPNDPAYIG